MYHVGPPREKKWATVLGMLCYDLSDKWGSHVNTQFRGFDYGHSVNICAGKGEDVDKGIKSSSVVFQKNEGKCFKIGT